MDDDKTKTTRNSSRMMDRYSMLDEDSIQKLSDSSSDNLDNLDNLENMDKPTHRYSSSHQFQNTVLTEKLTEVEKSYDSFGFNTYEESKRDNMNFGGNLVNIEALSSDDSNSSKINYGADQTDNTFDFVQPKIFVNDCNNDYKTNSTNKTNQFASLGEHKQKQADGLSDTNGSNQQPKYKEKTGSVGEHTNIIYNNIQSQNNKKNVVINSSSKKKIDQEKQKLKDELKRIKQEKQQHQARLACHTKDVNKLKNINREFEDRMTDLIDDNKLQKSERDQLHQHLDFYKKIEEKIGEDQDLNEFIEYSMSINKKLDIKLQTLNDNYIKINRKYTTLKANHEILEKKCIELEKEKKNLFDKSHNYKVEGKHQSWNLQDKEKQVRFQNDQIQMLHNEIGRLKVENSKIKRETTPKPVSNTLVKNKSIKRLNSTNKWTNSGDQPMTNSSNHNSRVLNILKENNRNMINTPATPSSRNGKSLTTKSNNKWVKDKGLSAFDSKKTTNIRTIEEKETICHQIQSVMSTTTAANLMTDLSSNYKKSQEIDSYNYDRLLDKKGGISSKLTSVSPKPKNQQTIQRTPQQKGKSNTYSIQMNNNSSKDISQSENNLQMSLLLKKLVDQEKENSKLKNEIQTSQQSYGNLGGGFNDSNMELGKLNQDVDKDTQLELYNYLQMKHFKLMKNTKVRESDDSKSTDAFTIKQKSVVLSENSSFLFQDLI